VEHRLFQQMVVQVNILAELGYVDSALLPEALQLRTTNPKTIEYSPTHEALVESLYTTAVSVSHL
jgi:hypothetical protein